MNDLYFLHRIHLAWLGSRPTCSGVTQWQRPHCALQGMHCKVSKPSLSNWIKKQKKNPHSGCLLTGAVLLPWGFFFFYIPNYNSVKTRAILHIFLVLGGLRTRGPRVAQLESCNSSRSQGGDKAAFSAAAAAAGLYPGPPFCVHQGATDTAASAFAFNETPSSLSNINTFNTESSFPTSKQHIHVLLFIYSSDFFFFLFLPTAYS